VARLIKDIATNNGMVAANRMRASLSAMCAWAMKETDFVEGNPVINTHAAGKEKARDRVLENAEIKVIWSALADDECGTIVKLLLLTAQRLNEVAGLRWAEVDFERNRIALPADRTKNRRAHHVPMSDSVRELLEVPSLFGEPTGVPLRIIGPTGEDLEVGFDLAAVHHPSERVRLINGRARRITHIALIALSASEN
jgi:integrase